MNVQQEETELGKDRLGIRS